MDVFRVVSIIAVGFFAVYFVMLVVGGWYMHFSLKGIATRPPSSREVQKYAFEDIQFLGGSGNTLYGWFIKAQHGVSRRTIILVHGWGHTRATMLPQIDFFVQNGFNVFAYDQRCHGSSQVARLTFGVNEGRDFSKALDVVAARPDVDKSQIFAYGISLGGAAIVCAAPFETLLKAIIWEGPWAFDECMTGYMAERKFGLVLGVILKSALTLGAALWGDGRPNHGYPVEYITHIYPTPIFFIRGNDDPCVPYPCAKAIIDAAQEPKEIWLNENGSHRRSLQFYPDEFKARVLGFIEKSLAQ